jgi:hypothetical protein
MCRGAGGHKYKIAASLRDHEVDSCNSEQSTSSNSPFAKFSFATGGVYDQDKAMASPSARSICAH